MSQVPTIEPYMTASPISIGRDQPLTRAHDLMKLHQIRHLPVLDGGVLLGVVSERDLSLVEALPGVDPALVIVEDAMSTSIHAVPPSTPLDEVVSTMAERKYGCTVVMQNGKAVGIFTTVDACRVLAELLRAGVRR